MRSISASATVYPEWLTTLATCARGAGAAPGTVGTATRTVARGRSVGRAELVLAVGGPCGGLRGEKRRSITHMSCHDGMCSPITFLAMCGSLKLTGTARTSLERSCCPCHTPSEAHTAFVSGGAAGGNVTLAMSEKTFFIDQSASQRNSSYPGSTRKSGDFNINSTPDWLVRSTRRLLTVPDTASSWSTYVSIHGPHSLWSKDSRELSAIL
mmetsp:Transcript_25549/g.82441  ORF Transcript_25549/g.82441 Transcript_25549/m.82441 type:complete len:211 (+) Transcript_25549:961-1593(+)